MTEGVTGGANEGSNLRPFFVSVGVLHPRVHIHARRRHRAPAKAAPAKAQACGQRLKPSIARLRPNNGITEVVARAASR